jgi:uncharacterized protein with NAD-binding domain and iron-sulfur cluster
MKVAIVGGGVGAMTAAYWLTKPYPEGPKEEMDITVYQLGWRLGGKGASGRNQQAANRIEEHGLHIWMGFYANAFRIMREVYGELNRPEGAPLRTWKDAFKPQNVITMMQPKTPDMTDWLPAWVIPTPPRPGDPGDQTGFPTPCGYIGTITAHVHGHVHDFLHGDSHDPCPPHRLSPAEAGPIQAVHEALSAARAQAPPPHHPGQPTPDVEHDHRLLRGTLEAAQKLIHVALDLSSNCLGVERVLLLADLGVATLLGLIRDLCDKPWEAIDGQEWRAWLTQNGLYRANYWGSLTRAMYDLVFGYPQGIPTSENASLAAGTTACATLRILFDYYGALFMKMQAGMGDTVFAPLYDVLRKRGVKFKFFHRLRDVVPSEDGTTIERLHIGVQAQTWAPEYHPLFDVNQLSCWPSTPLYDQLVQGNELRERNINLEAYDAPWDDVEELVLEKSNGDFDLVVFGLSVGAVPFVCAKLLEQKESWRLMYEKVLSVNTQGFQFWMSRNIAELGWAPALNGGCYGQRAVLGTFVEPLDTWADMSQLIPREQWVVPMNNIAYFCGVLEEGGTLQTVIDGARTYLERDLGVLWPAALRGGKFRYDRLCVNVPGVRFSDDERFNRQYFTANTQPTERYVLSVAGSTAYRLDPASPGYDNLVLAGDWVANGFAIGCVESGVLGGMKGVRNFCPGMVIVE